MHMNDLPIEKRSISDETVLNQIYYIRNQKIMLDSDLAALYGVETKVLNQAVRRNLIRFPTDFMFELSKEEHDSLRSQFVTLKNRGGHTKYLPFAFTELGVAMLSSILKSDHAILVHIEIVRAFSKMRQILADTTEVRLELEQFKTKLAKQETKLNNHDKNIELVFHYLDELLEKIDEPLPKQEIGFRLGDV